MYRMKRKPSNRNRILVTGKEAYRAGKDNARKMAIMWQANFNNQNYSYEELVVWRQSFTCLARKYGLVREFRENGII